MQALCCADLAQGSGRWLECTFIFQDPPRPRGPQVSTGSLRQGQQTPAVQRPQHLLQGLLDTDKGLGLLSQLWGPRTRRERMGNPRSSPNLGGPWARKPLTVRTLGPSQTVYKPVSQGWRPECRSRGPEGPGGLAAGRGLERDPPGAPGLKPGGTRGRSMCPALGHPWDPRRLGGLEGAEAHGTALDMAHSGSPSRAPHQHLLPA